MSTLANCNAKITRLLHIFKEEIKILRAGRLADIAMIIPLKTNAMSELESALNELDKKDAVLQLRSSLIDLDKRGQQNARLLQSVLAGARDAGARLAKMQSSHAQVGTYDVNGRKHNLAFDHVSKNLIV